MKRSKAVFVLVLIAALIGVAGSARADGQPCGEELARQIGTVASAAGKSVHLDQIVTVSAPGATVAATTIQGYEQVPATDLPKGVDAGFLYLDAPSSGIPTGFYTVRASAKAGDVRVGDFDGTVQLVTPDGEVAAELPAKMDAFSLSVPAELPYPRTTVDAGARRKWNENYLIIDYWCPNGTHFVFVVFFDPFWP